MKKIGLGLALIGSLIVSAQSTLPEINVDGIIALIGKNKILYSDVQMDLFNRKMQGQDINSINKCEVFEDILVGKLLLHKADLDTVIAPEDRVDMYVKQRLDYFVSQIGSEEALENYFGKKMKDIRVQMFQTIETQMRTQMVRQDLEKDIKVNLTDVRSFFEAIPKDSLYEVERKYQYQIIAIKPKITEESKQEVIDKLNSIREDVLQNGSSFGLKALLYSQDPGSVKSRGRYPKVGKGQFVKEFETVAFKMKEGEISKPFETIYGYHIVQLHAKKGAVLDLSHILISPSVTDQAKDQTLEFAETLKQKIDSNLLKPSHIENYIRYNELDYEVSIYNGKNQTNSSQVEQTQITQPILSVLEETEKDIWASPFFLSKDEVEDRKYKQYGVVYLLKKQDEIEPHKLSLTIDYDELRTKALVEKKTKNFMQWIKDTSAKTGVFISDSYQDCELKYQWKK